MFKKIQPVILCGGDGRRLWPFSHPARPKPFLPLNKDKFPGQNKSTLFNETLKRIRDTALFLPPVIVAGESQAPLIQEHLADFDSPATVMLEPEGRNTAPAFAAAALRAQTTGREEHPLLMLPADHLISPAEQFHADIKTASAALGDNIILFGIRPDEPVSDFGYILSTKTDTDTGDDNVRRIERFVEKPPADEARRLIDTGGAYWNSGIFLMTAQTYITALKTQAPAIIESVCAARKTNSEKTLKINGRHTVTLIELGEAFAKAPARSVDKAVIETGENIHMLPAGFTWADMGLWRALWQTADKDASQTAKTGPVITADCQNSYIHSDGPVICAVGMNNVTVYARDGIVFVAPVNGHPDYQETVNRVNREYPGALDKTSTD